jgi:energy-coupling factor transporter transmembrane protein EcfT
MANMTTIASIAVVAVSFIGAFVLAAVLIGQLSHRRWRSAFKSFVIFALLVFAMAKAMDLGVHDGSWNQLIHARCERERGVDAFKCP